MWRATIAVLQQERSLVRELNRNPALLALCGFSPLDYQDKPKVKIDDDGKLDVSGTPQHGPRKLQLLPVPEKSP